MTDPQHGGTADAINPTALRPTALRPHLPVTVPNIEPAALRIADGHLVERTWDCTCGAPEIGVGIVHEPGCGDRAVMSVDQLVALVTTPRVGAPDPTPDGDCPASQGHYKCTWDRGHLGPHVAGTGEMVVAVWPVPGTGDVRGLVTAIWGAR